jgi:HK97 gp10 family phage protein
VANRVTITGIADVNRILSEIAPNEARNLLRATITEVAKDVAKLATENAPKESGALKNAISHKRERGKRNILAASAGVGKDAFYWRFPEYGQGPDGVEHAFFLRAVRSIEPELEARYLNIFGQKLENRLARLRKKG